MRFLMLMRTRQVATGGTAEDFEAWADFERTAREAGVYVDGAALHDPAEGAVVQTQLAGHELPEAARGGVATDDVPIAAYYVLDCADADQAVAWANRLPTRGDVEVRRLVEFDA